MALLNTAKPLAETLIRYGLKGTFEKSNCPLASVVAVRSSPLTTLTRWTVAPGITAPVGSVTVPRTAPALPLWANTLSPHENKKTKGKNLEILLNLNNI
jgi:hypothetical protein